MKIQLNAAARLQSVEAVSKEMKAEMSAAFAKFVEVFGKKYKKGEHDSLEEVYWEFSGGKAPFGEGVIIGLSYDRNTDSMTYDIDGDDIMEQSKPFKTADKLFVDLKRLPRKYKGSVESGVEKKLLSMISRL